MFVMTKNSISSPHLDSEIDSWEQLYRRYSRAVFRWALFFGVAESGAEEVTQDVFMTVLRKIDRCPDEKKLSAWLFQTTRKHSANYRRKRWFKEMFWPIRLDAKPDRDFKQPQSHPQLSLEIEQILKRLPVKLVEVLILHDLDGLSRREISEQLGIAAGTVASRLNKARRLFRDTWNPGD